MGSIFAKAMEDNFKKNQEFMLSMQSLQLERQIAMQNAMRERAMAMQIGRSRELLRWTGTFYVLATGALIKGYQKTKRGGLLAPILPLSFITAYQTDLAYGGKFNRIRGMADNILTNEMGLLALPSGLPTFEEIEERRKGKK